ncbi:MAG: phytoene desaturase family protein [Calditrichaceae bacterium]
MAKRVTVIGAGLGGLAAAIRLASMGFEVTVFEKNAKPGGKMNEIVNHAYRFDTGPSLLTMPSIIDELFEFAGFNRSDFLEFRPVDPVCRYFFNDGSIFDTFNNPDKMIFSLAGLAPNEVENYQKFMAYSRDLYERAGQLFLTTPIHERKKIFRSGFLSRLAEIHKIDPFRTVHQGVSGFFNDERLIQLFDRYATYNGSDPFRAPATLNMIPYLEAHPGAFYISGGMYRLVEAMLKIAAALNIDIRTSTTVEKIIHKNRKVEAVRIDGHVLKTDYVVCNADVVSAYSDLIDGLPKKAKHYQKLEPSLSGMVFLWGINGENPGLKHHNIIFSNDYKKEFSQLFNDHQHPDDPTIYVAITSKTDPEHAPENGENWFVLVNMPYLTDQNEWETDIEAVRKNILRKLSEHGINVAGKIETEKVLTPESFQNLYGANRGSIYGLSSNSRSSAFLRPANRSREIEGLYFAGGSAHPGGGIPLVILAGKMTADLIGETMNYSKKDIFEIKV